MKNWVKRSFTTSHPSFQTRISKTNKLTDTIIAVTMHFLKKKEIH